jgi:GT2 family glycosyltransferase
LSDVHVSIVIPTFARLEGLRSCLGGLARMTFDMSRAEIIVVDDSGGNPEVEKVAAQFASALRIRTISKTNGGPASARNGGAYAAQGRFLAFIDDDCVPAHDWLSSLMTVLEQHSGALAGGPVLNGLPDDPFAAASQDIATYVARHYAEGRGRERFFTTNNFALSSARFSELGGFDASIPSWTAEDKEFCDRWRDRGYPMIWVSNARVHHAHALKFSSFVRQHYDYGRGILSFRLKRANRKGKRIVPESAGFYGGLVFNPLVRERNLRAVREVGLLLLSQAATIAGALVSALHVAPRPDTAEAAAQQPVSPAEGA